MTMAPPFDLRVRQITYEADGVISLELDDPDARELPAWTPGAHLELELASGLIRHYSLCGDPADRRAYRIAVLREPTGRGGSLELHDRTRVGDPIRVRAVPNRFPLVDAGSYLFIAGGIGITPLLPMLRTIAGHRPCTLFYGGRSRRSMAFVTELSRLAGLDLRLRPQDRFGLLDLDEAFSTCQSNTAIYCCGPEPLIAAATERSTAQDRYPALHIERFSAATRTTDAANDMHLDDIFEVELARAGTSVKVEPEQTVLDALRSVLPDMPSSCEEGICGTCEVRVLDGVPEHRDNILSDAERESGDCMFVCVSRSRTPRLVLDL